MTARRPDAPTYSKRPSTPRPITVVVSPGAKFISSNDRAGSWHVKAKLTTIWRQATAVHIRAQRPAAIPTCELHVTVHRTSNRRSDHLNVADTIKACVDGAVDAGLLTDDNDAVIRKTTIERGPNRGVPSLTISFEPIGV